MLESPGLNPMGDIVFFGGKICYTVTLMPDLLTHDGQNRKTGQVECWYFRYRHQGMMTLEVGECNRNALRPNVIGTVVGS